MIHIDPQPEPAMFDSAVRKPGRAFLAKVPHPMGAQWRGREYWRAAGQVLHQTYRGVCAYSCHWIPHDTGARTVEHFKAKATNPDQAYEWSNFRLVCSTLNGRKGTRTILDPFVIPTGWFHIDFPSLLVKASPNLSAEVQRQVEDARDILGLNDEGTCLASRFHYISALCCNDISFDYLRRSAPFLAAEIDRQGLAGTIKDVMGFAC